MSMTCPAMCSHSFLVGNEESTTGSWLINEADILFKSFMKEVSSFESALDHV